MPGVTRLILASASPRRRKMLASLGVEFEAVSPGVEELREGAAPEELVVENARRKAASGLELANARPGDRVLGVDTEVVLEGRLLGKAASVDEARDRLLALSGRTHEVLSGVVLTAVGGIGAGYARRFGSLPGGAEERPAETERSGVASSLVTFTDLDDRTVSRYLASGEWRDRAGAYAIQGLGSTLVERLDGEFANVVGLPLQLLAELAPDLFPPISSHSAGMAKKPGPAVYP